MPKKRVVKTLQAPVLQRAQAAKAPQKSVLTRDIAGPLLGGVRSIWREGVATGLTPQRLGAVLRAADENEGHDYLTLAEEMEEREWHYRSVLSTRKLAVAGLDVAVMAGGEDAKAKQIAEAVERFIKRPEFADLKMDLLDALAKGYSVCEVIWDLEGATWEHARYEWRDPRWFKFDQDTGRELRLIDEANPFGIALEPYKFVSHIAKLKTGLPLRGGLARVACAAYMCKSYAVKDWLAFAEVFGMPLRIGKYHPGATEEDIAKLMAALTGLGTDAAAAIPEQMVIELSDAVKSSGGDSLFKSLGDWLDKQVSKAVLGQTMTTDDGSSRAQAVVHNDVREDLIRADARQLQNTLNAQLIRPYVDLNFGAQEAYPSIQLIIKEPEDLAVLAAALPPFIDRGLRVSTAAIYEKFGLTEPETGAEVLGASAGGAGALNRAMNARQTQTDGIDDLVDDALKNWEPLIDPVLQPILTLARTVTDYEEFMRRLPLVVHSMDATEIVKSLATQAFIARGMGDVKDKP